MNETHTLADRELWLLVGSQHLYGPQAIAQVGEHAEQVAAALDAATVIPTRVRLHGVLTTADEIHRACRDANGDDACVGVIVWMHTFSPAQMWIRGLRELDRPMLHLHTQFHRELPWAEIDMDFMNLNQSAHGDREFAHMATRLAIVRTTVSGHWSDDRVHARIGRFARAACGRAHARGLSVARFGDNMRNVAVTEGDKVEAHVVLGTSISGYGVGDLVDAMEGVSAADVAVIAEGYDARYAVVPELREGGPRRESLLVAARIEAGLRAFLTDHGCGAFTDTFEDLHGLRQLPGIPAQQLMADGYGFGGEGDWKTALLVSLFKAMSEGLPGGTSFMEDYTYDLTPGEERILGAHMLEVCPSIAAERPTCEIHPLGIGDREDPVRLVFTGAPGEAIAVSLVDLGDRLRLIANVVDVVTPPYDLPRLPVARALWRPRPDFFVATEGWLIAGGAHHTVLTYALDLETITIWATLMGIELVVIDERTDLPGLERELRHNDASYRPSRHTPHI